jgi:hypothetical protein
MAERLTDAEIADLKSKVPHNSPHRSCGMEGCLEMSQAPMLDGWSYGVDDGVLFCPKHLRPEGEA